MVQPRTSRCRFFGSLTDRIAVSRAADRLRAVPGVCELDIDLAHGVVDVRCHDEAAVVRRVATAARQAGLVAGDLT